MKKLFTTTILTLTLLSTTAQAKIVHWDSIKDFKKATDYYQRLDKNPQPPITLQPYFQGKDLLERVNIQVNRDIKYQSELQGQDYWQTPAETMKKGSGDCEDFALLKMYTLKQSGIPENAMYIEQGINETTGEMHAILEVIIDNKIYYLDNMQEDITHNSIKPLGAYTINRFGVNFYIEDK